MDRNELEIIRKRCELATLGPWGFARADRNSRMRPCIHQVEDGAATGILIAVVGSTKPYELRGRNDQCYMDAHFIAQARTDIPLLLEYIDQLEKKLEKYEGP